MFYFLSDIKLPWDNYFEVKIKIVHGNTFLIYFDNFQGKLERCKRDLMKLSKDSFENVSKWRREGVKVTLPDKLIKL